MVCLEFCFNIRLRIPFRNKKQKTKTKKTPLNRFPIQIFKVDGGILHAVSLYSGSGETPPLPEYTDQCCSLLPVVLSGFYPTGWLDISQLVNRFLCNPAGPVEFRSMYGQFKGEVHLFRKSFTFRNK